MTVQWVGYDTGANYRLEISRDTTLGPGLLFATPLASVPVSLTAAGAPSTSVLVAPLAPGTYFVHVVDDYTGLWIEFQTALCAQLGCVVTWDGTPLAIASPMTDLVVAAPKAARPAAVAHWWDNCTQLHKRYPHGVGRVGAKDHTVGVPVTTFKRSNALYKLAMLHNRSLDRDHDGIACEAAWLPRVLLNR